MKIERTDVFAKWLDVLKDLQARARIQARIARLTEGNPGQCRHLGDGVSELKVDVGAGYRVYYAQRGRVLVILLCGGDKATQQADIRLAKAMVKQL